MKAMVTTKYGPPEVLQLQQVEKPSPRRHEVLIKIHATTVESGDCRARSCNLSGVPFLQRVLARLVLGISKPRNPIQGLWLAGEIEAVGKSVTKFKPGDQVVARTPDLKFGAYAQFTCQSEKSRMALKPANLSFEEAVAIPFGGVTALYFLRKHGIQRGQNVLIYGASGAVGVSAVQIANSFEAKVTGVCGTANLGMVKSLGADAVMDYTQEDFTAGHASFDLIFDCVGKISRARCQNILKPEGKYISVATSGHVKFGADDLMVLKELVESGKLKPVLDRTYRLEELAEAHRYVDQGHKRGSVVIQVS
ncbi:MAG: NAD(P)-dependent alcohol dehydrogenase [Deltaproteobacteria bacterium]|nr:NAD(P)-dependent alcohol dehydrogenase [Deltaproteobacteria bacterium]